MARFPVLSIEEARKVVGHIHRFRTIDQPMQNVRRIALDALRAEGHIPSLCVLDESTSQLDPFRKFLLARDASTLNTASFETVRIPLERPGRYSVCVSSQVGCALACSFCATGRLGLDRNLETWEIIEQIHTVRATLTKGERVSGVVFQGMGEPLANLDRVLDALAVISDPAALAIDGRRVTVCTSGLPSGIRRLANEAPNVRLGLSIGSFDKARRATIMPIEKSHSIDEVMDAAVEHTIKTRQSPMWALTLLAGINDDLDEAIRVAERAAQFTAASGHRPRISLIPYNSIGADDPFVRTSDAQLTAFRDTMAARGFPPHLRYSGGSDVGAACGQLARKYDEETSTTHAPPTDRLIALGNRARPSAN